MVQLNQLDDLSNYLSTTPVVGCLADTNFLFGLAYKDDRLFEKANDVHDLLCEYKIPIYINVISRMEFIDLIFRKQVTDGCVQLFNKTDQYSKETPLYRILKDIRDKNTAGKRKNEIYKVDEWRLKQLRKLISDDFGLKDWPDFCATYVGEKLLNEWILIEEDLGLNFIEILEDQTNDLFPKSVYWKDMVKLMGEYGVRGPDAMIYNLFDTGQISLLISGDSDFSTKIQNPLADKNNKAVYIL